MMAKIFESTKDSFVKKVLINSYPGDLLASVKSDSAISYLSKI